MKNFTFITLIFILSILGNGLFAQCTPDPNGPVIPGIYPNDSLPDGDIGVPYDEVFQLVLPTDTSVNLGIVVLDASFCSFKLDTFLNLPAGLIYECDDADCDWDIDHTGIVNRGCVRISGTPTSKIIDDTLRASITITPGIYDTTSMFCDTDSLRMLAGAFWPLVQSFLTQESVTGMRINGNVGIEEKLIREAVDLTVYPNPLEGSGYVKFNLAERSDVVMDILDPMGRVVRHLHDGFATSGENIMEISDSGLASGLYLIRLQLDNGKYVITKKMTVR